ncbi:hypothetical protein CPB86DRAFT_779767 [Serendipita vermifera]|nr:hypothetical protein CPB86DRAFT_779767 [Serendipita vermifera]
MSGSANAQQTLQNPLVIEIASLKSSLARYQNAANSANIHLQRQALDSSVLAARCQALERDNAILREEVELLRANPDATPSSATIQVSELTLALRRVSDQLLQSEDALREQGEQFKQAINAEKRAQYEAQEAMEAVNAARAREQEAKAQLREVKTELVKKEEERKMTDLVVREYADLVRTMEGRASVSVPAVPNSAPANSAEIPVASNGPEKEFGHSRGPSVGNGAAWPSSNETLAGPQGVTGTNSTKLIESMNEGRAGLQRLLADFHAHTEKLEQEMANLYAGMEELAIKLNASEKASMEDQQELARLQSELAKAVWSDKSAATMVERYMSFSQQSTNLLQNALQTQKKRHAATISTFERQIAALLQQAEKEKRKADKLRDIFDDLAMEISKESAGRRREISVRLDLMERERKVGRLLEKWIDGLKREQSGSLEVSTEDKVQYATNILATLRGSADQSTWTEEEDARIQNLMTSVQDLRDELEEQTSKRMQLEREMWQLQSGHKEVKSQSRSVEAHPTLERAVNSMDQPNTSSMGKNSTDQPITSDGSEKPTEPHPTATAPPPSSELDAAKDEAEVTSSSPRILENTPVEAPLPEATGLAGSNNEFTSLPQAPPNQGEPPYDQPTRDHLLAQLKRIDQRYSSLQASFSDCHSTLQDVQSNLNIEEEVPQHAIPKIYLVAAVERLYDYCEDARVELEIIIADEARIAQGYETLLKISAAEYLRNESWRQKIDSFIEGTDSSIEKAKSNFESKLDNLMHDIAIIKRTLHESIDQEAATDSLSRSASLDNHLPDTNAAFRPSSPVRIVKPNARKLSNGRSMASSPEDAFNWRAFTSTIRSPPSRSSSPVPRTAPTFGSLMGMRRSSNASISKQNDASPGDTDLNPLNHLGLRVAMPTLRSTQGYSPHSSHLNISSPFPFSSLRSNFSDAPESDTLPKSAPLSRVGSGWFGKPSGIARTRTVSSIHSVGVGAGVGMNGLTSLKHDTTKELSPADLEAETIEQIE